jgi:guanyl-specific ribonuclease Sa
MEGMKTAAKKRNSRASGVIALMLVLASALVFASPATASSASHAGPKTRAEVSERFSLKSIERSPESPVNSSRIYDSLDEVALECTVAPKGTVTRFVTGADGQIKDLGPTLDRIKNGVKFPHRNDGTIFKNREGLLPNKPAGYWTEYVHPTPGGKGPGLQRIVIGKNGEIYFTSDHYKTFIPLNPNGGAW